MFVRCGTQTGPGQDQFRVGAALLHRRAPGPAGGSVALEELAARTGGYDIDEAGARRVNSPYVRGFAELPTTITRGAG